MTPAHHHPPATPGTNHPCPPPPPPLSQPLVAAAPQNIKRDFVSGVLSEEELGNKLHVYELRQAEYAGRVHNLRSYDAVSRDLLQRWAFPFVPDTNVLSLGGSPAWGQTSYRWGRGGRRSGWAGAPRPG